MKARVKRRAGSPAKKAIARSHATGTEAIEASLRALRAGSMVVVVDDEDRENEGDFVMAAEKTMAEDVNFLTRDARGLLCVSMPGTRLEELGLALMTPLNTARCSGIGIGRTGNGRSFRPPLPGSFQGQS